MITMIHPDMNASTGRRAIPISPWVITNVRSIDESAPATPNTLYALEANILAKTHAHIPVRSHWSGVAPLATAREIERGILIAVTASALLRFVWRRFWICFRMGIGLALRCTDEYDSLGVFYHLKFEKEYIFIWEIQLIFSDFCDSADELDVYLWLLVILDTHTKSSGVRVMDWFKRQIF